MTDIARLLEASIKIEKQRKLIAAQGAYILLLRTKLGERDSFDVSADELPALLRRQAE